MGELYDRQNKVPQRVTHWEKPCPACDVTVSRDTALEHLHSGHGYMFRVEPWIQKLGVPEDSFDGLIAFIRKYDKESS